MSDGQPWTKEQEARLIELWSCIDENGGLISITEIAKLMGTSRQSVAKKAPRMNLPPRFAPQKHKWTAEENDRYMHMWRDGLSFAAIGAAIGVGKNSAVSHSHALGLPHRPSNRKRPEERAVPLPAMITRLPRVAPPSLPIPPPKACCYPLWPHGARPTQEFCGAALMPGRSWCAEHLAVVTAKPADVPVSEWRAVNNAEGMLRRGFIA